MLTSKTISAQPYDPGHWLGATRLLDLDDPKLRIRAMRVTQLAASDTQKAIFLHDFVKSLPFGCVAAFNHVPAAGVLRAGHGDCHTKGTLFVALLRSVGIPARLRFVLLSSSFLKGIIEIPQGQITHAVAEVYLKGRWVQTDTYVPDEPFETQALALLKKRNETIGLGVHIDALRDWDGCQSAHSQYCDEDPASLPMRDLGVAHDPEHFYSDESNEEFQLGWLTRVKWVLAAAVVNRRVDQIRDSEAENT